MTDDYREVDIPLVRLTRPYVQPLEAHTDRLDAQIDALERDLTEIHDKAQPTLDALSAKVPETDGTPTAVEWLAKRAAKADLDLAIYTRDLAAAEVRVESAKATAERDNLVLRIGQVEHLAGGSDPVLSPGNDDELAIWTLWAQESTIDLATAEATLQLARKRLEHAKKGRREVHDALRRMKRGDERTARK